MSDECARCALVAVVAEKMGKVLDRAELYGVEPVKPPLAITVNVHGTPDDLNKAIAGMISKIPPGMGLL